MLTILLYSILAVLVFGGIPAVITKFIEWRTDRFLDDKIGGWLMKQTNIVVQIFPPLENARSLAEMENFFINIGNIFTSKSKKDLFVEGKYYENYIFEIHSRGGQIAFFCQMNRNHLPVFRAALAAHYPGTNVVECPDPLINWPDEWKKGGFGIYKDLYCTDLQFAGKSDLFPVRKWEHFQRGADAPTTDPMMTLITGLEELSEGDYMVVQYILRPDSAYRTDDAKRWGKEIKALREEFTKNAVVEADDSGKVTALTQQEKDIINACEQKISGENMYGKIRVMILSDKPAPIRLIGTLMSYLKQYASERQFLKPNGDTKTNVSDDGGRFGVFGPKLGAWLDTFYWKKEQDWRKKMMYRGFKRRSLSKGSQPTFINVKELAALFHFPITYKEADKSLLNRVTTDYGSSNSLVVGQAPTNLPM